VDFLAKGIGDHGKNTVNKVTVAEDFTRGWILHFVAEADHGS
jgi:hypothetical protein